MLRDRLFTAAIGVGGVTVIVTILLIFLYLLYAVLPLFVPSSMLDEKVTEIIAPDIEVGSILSNAEASRLAWVRRDGAVQAIDLANGELPTAYLPVPEGMEITASARQGDFLVVAMTSGDLLFAKVPLDTEIAQPLLKFPWGRLPIALEGEPVVALDFVRQPEGMLVATLDRSGEVALFRVSVAQGVAIATPILMPSLPFRTQQLLLSKDQKWLYLADEHGGLNLLTLDEHEPRFVDHHRISRQGEITAMALLSGGYSLLLGTSEGRIQQWFPLLDKDGNPHLQLVREWQEGQAAIQQILPEQFRKVFAAVDAQGELRLFYSTADESLLQQSLPHHSDSQWMLSAQGQRMVAITPGDALAVWQIKNPHPEVSIKALWQKVWYESYREPQYLWQSSGGSSEYEPKYSLMPLTFGTLKAAFYAMLFAIPLAILGAIYTAYFMSQRLREVVKPTIEMMEALPTVILGLLAGLWLAPLLEQYLLGAFVFIIILPLAVLAFGFVWQLGTQRSINGGFSWQIFLLFPVLLLCLWLGQQLNQPLELMFFGGDVRSWLHDHDFGYDQRNAMVVGIAMGFAIIPTIFSLTEDAIYSVPEHLVEGSLALGATHWQTLSKVIVPTASPAIFSAVMIGFGRAMGETMIVLMATGNTPIMEMDLLNGLRSLAANIAVEMPESAVNSSHYRVLFLAAFILLLFTFALNTVAEMVRYRLRNRYSQL